jgi:hypothetical protein
MVMHSLWMLLDPELVLLLSTRSLEVLHGHAPLGEFDIDLAAAGLEVVEARAQVAEGGLPLQDVGFLGVAALLEVGDLLA